MPVEDVVKTKQVTKNIRFGEIRTKSAKTVDSLEEKRVAMEEKAAKKQLRTDRGMEERFVKSERVVSRIGKYVDIKTPIRFKRALQLETFRAESRIEDEFKEIMKPYEDEIKSQLEEIGGINLTYLPENIQQCDVAFRHLNTIYFRFATEISRIVQVLEQTKKESEGQEKFAVRKQQAEVKRKSQREIHAQRKQKNEDMGFNSDDEIKYFKIKQKYLQLKSFIN